MTPLTKAAHASKLQGQQGIRSIAPIYIRSPTDITNSRPYHFFTRLMPVSPPAGQGYGRIS